MAMAKMLLKNLNKRVEDMMPTPSSVQTKPQQKQRQQLTTAPNTTASFRQTKTVKNSDIFA
jgi:hypothetical protein